MDLKCNGERYRSRVWLHRFRFAQKRTQFQRWQLLFLILAGWINRRQQDAIEYLMTENRVLREKLGKNRILLSDDQRR